MLLLTRIAFQILLPGVLALTGVLLLVLFLFYALATHPVLALIPVAIIALALYGIYWYDKRRHRERGDDLDADDPFAGMR